MIKHSAALIFPNGEVIHGFGIGKKNQTIGEICFNTAITGYQEILTDPSYSGQIITFTFPHIGNIGVNEFDIESIKPRVKGLIIREAITNPASYRAQNHLNEWLIKNEITGISGVDTRKIAKSIRENGAKNVAIIYSDNIENINVNATVEELGKITDLRGVELAYSASLNKNYSWQNEGKWQQQNNSYNQVRDKKQKIVAIDFGAKLNILRCLTQAGFDVQILPAKTTSEEILKLNPAGVFLSNGPGDPFETGKYAIPTIQKIVEKNIPLFGICLGHQLLALAMGAKTIKMHQGHRGANHPVQDLKTKKVEITSQNHGFTVDEKTLPSNLEITHRSLFDGTIEGIKVKDKLAFSVQYHPESSPGPSDSYYLFERFIGLINNA
jgi:carbamoyl-phosphate synthase small subunit